MRVLIVQSDFSFAADSLVGVAGSLIESVSTDFDNAPAAARDQEFDAVVIDVGRDAQAAHLVQLLRLANVRTSILLIAPTDRLLEVVRSLSAGADDYMTLPLNTEVLVKRLFRMSREHSARIRPVVRLGKLKIDVERRMLHVNGERLHLTGKEFQMLELLVSHQGQTVTKGMFLDHLYSGTYEPVMKVVDVFICKLRKKIQAACGVNYIETIWGRGYVMRDPEAEVVETHRAMAA